MKTRSTWARYRMTGPRSHSIGRGRNKSFATETGRNSGERCTMTALRNCRSVRERNNGGRCTMTLPNYRSSGMARNRNRCGDYTSGPGCRTMKTSRARHCFSMALSKTGYLRSPRRTAAGPYRNGPFRPGAGRTARNRPSTAGRTGNRPNSPGSSGRGKSGNSAKSPAGPALPMRKKSGGLTLRTGFPLLKDNS
jgi:hypothetical protein